MTDQNDIMNLLSYILKKTEKIVTAIYMVTDYFEGDEPLKATFRNLGVKLISVNYYLINTPISEHYHVFKDVDDTVAEILSFLNIAHTVNIISDMNAQILKKEILNIQGLYGQLKPKPSMLSDEFFNVGILPQITQKTYENQPQIKNDIKTTQIKTSSEIQNDINYRKEKILNLIKDKGQATIKDIKLNLKDISEKTIQRDLNSLISAGQIIKKGDKRWSVYSINN